MVESQAKIGTIVIYWSVVREDGGREQPEKTIITSECWKVGGQTVCCVLGKSGGVSIKHLDTITPGSLIAAKLSGLKDITNEDLENATRKFFEDRGINAYNLKIG